ncbi:amine oxidase [Chroococcidiopsis sp. CCALA 051]|uniref:GtrA family protein n=1 Tax=Chroococcidiopsis sp. CCALA 051 TaxID=869949 RepID=UPI000D0DDD87|nr:GtrA family protein [Chroococcidiopsis sp. CCALA 051]MBE9017623.1 FAD-dependent oxidoreductase [Chroococcidiopsidales cyanobacterium LEGE 13417]PSM48776.1 amine oxidase [Chroococcidiopsis sp. CCALA 051]
MSKANPIYILGAGPAGLAAAYTLTQKGQPVVVVERDTRVGGLAKSIEYQGFILDFGPHRFFTKLAPVLKLWSEVLGKDRVTVNRLTRIYYGGKYFSYPLKAKEALLTMGPIESVKILVSYAQSQLFPNRHPRNFAQWVTSRFGRRLFEIFFQAYTEKLWGIPCTEISADWAAQRIKGLSLLKAARSALLGNDGKVKTLIDRFEFPRLGSGQLYEKIGEYLHQHNQSVLLNTEVVQVHHDNSQVTQITLRNRQTGEESTVNCGGVISSVPISLLVQQMNPPAPSEAIAAAKSLKFRNTILVYLIVEGNNLFPDNWLYINEPSVQLGRVTNFANWSPEMLPNQHQTPLCCEYWCNYDEPMWQQPEAELLERAERELRKIGLLHHEKVSGGFVVRLPRTYPIYAGNYQQALSDIQSYLQPFSNLQLVGRYGAFKYNNQDHSLLMGILAAENVLSPGKHNLWSVNSDSEYQEEASATAKTTTHKTVKKPRQQKTLKVLKEFGGYVFTGGAATVVDVAIFSLLVQSGVWSVSALCVSYFMGLTTNFWLSRRFVFGIYWKNWLIQYAVFATVALNSLLANLGLLQLLMDDAGWNATAARLVSAACVALLSFTGHKMYSFASNQQEFVRKPE